MDLNQLKIELIQKINSCGDENLLRKIEQLLDEYSSEVNEEGEKYFSEVKNSAPNLHFQEKLDSLSISAEQEEVLAERYERYLQDGGKSFSWEEVREFIREENGF
jgi:hypothetical protein